jgi:hypothetical protein
MGTEESGYAELEGGYGTNAAEDWCRKPRGTSPESANTLYSSSFPSNAVGPLFMLRADGRSGVTGEELALAEADKDLRTDSRLKPFRNRSKLSRMRVAAPAFAAFFSTTFLARDGFDRCVIEEPERERATPASGSNGSRLNF